MFVTLSESIIVPAVCYYYQARRATYLICQQTEEFPDGVLIWSANEKLSDTPIKHCSRCGSRMFLENDVISVLDCTQGMLC